MPEPEPATGPARPARLSSAAVLPSAILIVVLGATLAWWAWQEGAYFGTVFLPGAVGLCAVAILLLVVVPGSSLRLDRVVGVGLGALIALGLWTLASGLWSPAPDAALADAQRVLTYALLFALGLWLGYLVRARPGLALAPFCIAAAVAGIAATIALLTSSTAADVLEYDGTLSFPLGYRNANAAFFAICLFGVLGFATEPELDWRLRGLALGTATVAIEMIMLSQSRGSIPAAAAAVAALLILSPQRLRTLCWLLLAALPALAVIPALTDLYMPGNTSETPLRVTPEMRAAGWAIVGSGLVSVAVAALLARLEGRVPGFSSRGGASNRIVLALLGGLVAALAVAFVIRVGDPIDWVGERVDEFKAGESDFTNQSSRFSLNAGSNRYDLWRVAVDDATADPLLGDGAGGFEYTYLQQKEVSYQNARDAHSVELEVLSELGIPGLALLLVSLACIAAAALRSRRAGPAAAALSAFALAGGAYWLVHASIDWFWTYPAVTATAFALLGVACAAAGWSEGASRLPRWRLAAIPALALLAISAIPPFLSERYVDGAYAVWRSDLQRAYDDLDRARSLNPLSDVPLLAEGAIAREAGDRERAIDAFSRAADQRPEEWAAHYLLASLNQGRDQAAARREIAIALELNPRDPRVRTLARRLGVAPRPS